jgi:hypothetical protein
MRSSGGFALGKGKGKAKRDLALMMQIAYE